MAENSLSPAFVKIEYTSVYGAHVMTVPSVPVEAGVYAPTGYAFDLRGAAVSVEVSDAVIDFVNVIKAFFPATVTFTAATVYAQATPEASPTPVASFTLGIAGTSGAAGWSQAAQATLTFRADDFTLFKLVFLDFSSGNTWSRNTVVGVGSPLEAVRNYVTAEATWVASRGGGRPVVFLQESRTLNEALRKRYGLT